MAHRVLEQWLQQQWRQPGLACGWVERPLDVQAITETHPFDGQVAPRKGNFVFQSNRVALIDQCVAKQVTQVFEQCFGPSGLGPHQRNGTVERIEQEVRPDPGLQLGQARGCGCRGAGLGPKYQPSHQGRGHGGTGTGTCHPGRALDQSGDRQHGAAIGPGQRTQRHATSVLHRFRQTPQPTLEGACHDQPGQGGRQSGGRQHGQAQQPVERCISPEHGPHGTHQLDKQHCPQHHAKLAGIEYQHRPGTRRRALPVLFLEGR